MFLKGPKNRVLLENEPLESEHLLITTDAHIREVLLYMNRNPIRCLSAFLDALLDLPVECVESKIFAPDPNRTLDIQLSFFIRI